MRSRGLVWIRLRTARFKIFGVFIAAIVSSHISSIYFPPGIYLLAPSIAEAEFLRTAPGVYQSMGRRAKVIVSTETPGLFFLYGPEVNLQDFSIESLQIQAAPGPAADAESKSAVGLTGPLHAFLAFDYEENRYTGVAVSSQSYRVQGNFTIEIGGMRVTVDNTNPYCSIVVDEPGRPPEVLGFFGLSPIVNDEGHEAVAMLEGNQFNEYRKVFSPYQLRPDGLYVNGRPVSSATVGLIIEPKNDCLKPTSAIISRSSLEKLSGDTESKRAQRLLAALLKRRKNKGPLDTMFRLRTTPEMIIAFDPIKNETFYVRTVPADQTVKIRPRGIDRICVIDRFKAGNK